MAIWHWKSPKEHEPTADVAEALETLEDHVFRLQPLSDDDKAMLHEVLIDNLHKLLPEDVRHLKMRLGVIGHSHALPQPQDMTQEERNAILDKALSEYATNEDKARAKALLG